MKASVIIPAFNAEKTIGDCLSALEKQSFKGFEVIVVDDGSRDNTAAVVRKFRRARLLQEKNAGPAVARNFGAREAGGDIIVFTDSDCVPESDWLEEMLRPFESKEVAGVQGRYMTRQREIVARVVQLEIEKRYEKMARHCYTDFIGGYSAAYRRKDFLEMKGFDEGFRIASGEDTEFSYRMQKAGRKMVFNQNAVTFHTHPVSFLKYLRIKFYRAFWRTKVYGRHRAKMAKDSYTSQMVKGQTALVYLSVLSLAGTPLFPESGVLAFAFLLLLFLSSLPFAAWAMRKDFVAGVLSPVFVFFRAVAFSAGLAAGMARGLAFK